jgi:glycosyltransferase involved in cell wall biosynthesis
VKKVNSKEKPLLSVCLITYNQVAFIRQAIESVLMQKVNFKWELVIADDFSTDGTKEIVLEYKENHPGIIRLIPRLKNVGPAKNWVDLITFPESKYIAYLEGDDYWTDFFKLQKQVDFLEANADYGLVFTDIDRLIVNENKYIKDYIKFLNHKIVDGYIFEELMNFQSIYVCLSSIVYRKEIQDKHINFSIFFERDWKLGDLPFLLVFARNSKIKFLNESTTVYRVLSHSASNSINPLKKYELHKSIYDVFDCYAEKYESSPDIKHKIFINANKSYLKDAFFLKDRTLSIRSRENLKSRGYQLTKMEWLYYYGVKITFINWVILKLFSVKNRVW